jgi:4-hydroxy-tetrahydrodipicolinate synthase
MEDEMKNDIRFEGNYAAVVTPFGEDGNLMIDAFAELMKWHIEQGVDGVFIAGDNGEGWALSSEERKLIAETAVKVSNGRIPIIMGVSAISARECISRAEIAAKAGVDAIGMSPQPSILQGTRGEVISRYLAVHKAVQMPMLIYNTPRMTGISIDVDLFGALCDALQVIGVKEASRDFLHITKMIATYGERICVFIGPGWFIFPGLALGARGFISTGPELFRGKASEFKKLALEQVTGEVSRLHFRLSVAYNALLGSGIGTPPAALKAALNMMGLPAGIPREPIQPLGPEENSRLKNILKELDLL